MPKGLRGFQKGEMNPSKIKGAWNKGLTKDTNEAVKRNAEATSKTLKGRIPLWLKGKKLNFIPKGAFKKGHISWAKGRKFSEEHIKNLRESHKGQVGLRGEKCHLWQGGISFEPYSTDWTETLKKSIRQRDKYTCQICSKEPAIICHHIDYNKKNCNPDNLITLCHSCHNKTNHNRNYWIRYFNG